MWKHASYKLETDRNIIRTNPNGAFNIESTMEFYPTLIKEIEGLNYNECIILEDVKNFDGATYDALDIANKYNKIINNIDKKIHRIFITPETLKLDLALSVVTEINRQNVKVFNNKSEAIKYIKTLNS